ncbi:unnamed protein product, partial [Heterotrigona itama]
KRLSYYPNSERTQKWPAIETPFIFYETPRANKIDEFYKLLTDHNTNIAIITESWLIPKDIIKFPSYQIYRQDGPLIISGILIIVHKDITTEDTPQPATSNRNIKQNQNSPRLTTGAASSPPPNKIYLQLQTKAGTEGKINNFRQKIPKPFRNATHKHQNQNQHFPEDPTHLGLVEQKNKHRRKFPKLGNPFHKLHRYLHSNLIHKHIMLLSNNKVTEPDKVSLLHLKKSQPNLLLHIQNLPQTAIFLRCGNSSK